MVSRKIIVLSLMKNLFHLFFLIFLILTQSFRPGTERIRKPVDPVGFATKGWQMDQLMLRINQKFGDKMEEAWNRNGVERFTAWKTVISPHDDYTYASWLYPAILKNIKATTIILIGVAHKAKKFNIEDKIVFDSYNGWSEPYGTVRVSSLREKITNGLPRSVYMYHDSLQQAEHSLEAIVPFLQYYNKNVEIVPILVPYMSYDKMKGSAAALALALYKIVQENDLKWSTDIAIVISTDAVHYGCEDWGGSDYAFYGCDSAGYRKALSHEYEIINASLSGEISPEKIKKFTEYTVQDTNYHTYKWTWCGRYSVPFGLLTTYYLAQNLRIGPIKGNLIGYTNSIDHDTIPVKDLKMGKTAGASIKHWVGYPALGYK
jgi:MEMO1 family protein